MFRSAIGWGTGVGLIIAIGALAGGDGARAQNKRQGIGVSQEAPDPVARGRYIVHSLSMCVQCHSPRDNAGNIRQGAVLRGAPVPVGGPTWIRDWAFQAPDITLLARSTPKDVVHVLTRGKRRDGTTPKSPMPSFRMTAEDAQAVVAYLQTIR